MNPAEWLLRSARVSPAAPALCHGAKIVADYAGFARRAGAIGAGLRASGVAPGDRVALFMTNRTDYLELVYGALFAGAPIVPINAKLHPREAAWIMEDAGATVAFVSADVGAELVAPSGCRVIAVGSAEHARLLASAPLTAPEPMAAGDMIWLFYTSGTTGKPKGVILTAANVEAMCFGYLADVDTVSSDDAILYAAPMSHGAGFYNFPHVMKGARHIVPESGGFEAEEVLDLAEQVGNVSMFAAPTMIRRLIDRAKAAGRSGEGLRTIIYGGGPMYLADILEAVEMLGPRFVQIYGQGESPMTITVLPREMVADRSHPRWRERLASVGFAQAPMQVRVVDEAGHDVPSGVTGEIIASGAAVMAGYWQKPEASAETLRDGWLWTGDMGMMDEDGFLTLQDRSKDVIISGGTNIYPREVEEALLLHPSVHEVAVVGRPDPEWGEDVVAFVTPTQGAEIDPAQLDRHCLAHIARFKRPKAYRVLDGLPKNNYGKILKTELRALLAQE
ncbi:class I adenylate-forming enzyme family protein [Haematobacter genomosp. 1]|uniref:3-methylmercaptopropionyl-CoA ligase n=1 Tax=Haematobacter genomosp. 1 TaxID=366618 RepID=A0A212ABA9_9RHOB|nr:AMP-binding protein [Haematobacter genomosp. 1]OWJ77879.1 AMP-dependent synthetase [Haematobacter genomosp. 1]